MYKYRYLVLVVFIGTLQSSISAFALTPIKHQSPKRNVQVSTPTVSLLSSQQRQSLQLLYVASNSNSNSNNNNNKRVAPKDDETLSYAERTRIFRRDTFNYDLWVKHRSTDRFVGNLIDILKSGVLRALIPEVTLMTSVATIICVYNTMLVTGYIDYYDIQHPPLVSFLPLLKIPSDFFTFMTPSLALLLVFKTNTSYKRWDEGRKNWGIMINSCRSIMRQGAAWIHESSTLSNEQKQCCMERLEQAVWSFPRSVTRHLLSENEDQNDFATDCRNKLRTDFAEDLIVARHKPTRALYEITLAINELPISERRQVSIDASTTILCDAMGSNERIFTSPVPRFYTRHTARFLEVWLLLIPFALYEPFTTSWNHWAMIPTTTIISLFLLGIEELGIQLEEPFGLLAQHGMTNNSIGKVATEAVEFRAIDYDRAMKAYTTNSNNSNNNNSY
jgi:ion channel-forming bestrophin family protein